MQQARWKIPCGFPILWARCPLTTYTYWVYNTLLLQARHWVQCQWVIYKATVISVNSRKCLEYLTQHESSGRCSKTVGLRQRERLWRKALCCDWLTHVSTVFIPWEWTTVQRRQRAEKAKGSSSLLLQPVNIITPGTLFHIITAPALLQNSYQSPGRSSDTAEP